MDRYPLSSLLWPLGHVRLIRLFLGPELKHVVEEIKETEQHFRRRFVSRNSPAPSPGRFFFRETKHEVTESRFSGFVRRSRIRTSSTSTSWEGAACWYMKSYNLPNQHKYALKNRVISKIEYGPVESWAVMSIFACSRG